MFEEDLECEVWLNGQIERSQEIKFMNRTFNKNEGIKTYINKRLKGMQITKAIRKVYI